MSKRPPARPSTAATLGRAIQLLALLGGSVAVAMTLAVLGAPGKSTAPALGLALLCGAAITIGWLIQRHAGAAGGPRR